MPGIEPAQPARDTSRPQTWRPGHERRIHCHMHVLSLTFGRSCVRSPGSGKICLLKLSAGHSIYTRWRVARPAVAYSSFRFLGAAYPHKEKGPFTVFVITDEADPPDRCRPFEDARDRGGLGQTVSTDDPSELPGGGDRLTPPVMRWCRRSNRRFWCQAAAPTPVTTGRKKGMTPMPARDIVSVAMTSLRHDVL